MIQKAGQYMVSIFGESYTVRSDESSDRIVQAASLVDATMKEIAGNAHMEAKSIAVLAALRLAYQLQGCQMRHSEGESLARFIDQELQRLELALPE